MIVCEGSVIRAYESDKLWFVLELTPHGILALGGTVQEFDLLRHFETDECSVDPIEHWRLAKLVGDCCQWCASDIRAARSPTQARNYL